MAVQPANPWQELESLPLGERYRWQNVYDLLLDASRDAGDKAALSFQLTPEPDAPSVTLDFDALASSVTSCANLLRWCGVRPRSGQSQWSSCALLLPNLPQTTVALLGAMTAGVAVPISPLLSPSAIAEILRESKASVLITLAPFPKTDIAERAAGALAEAPDVEYVFEVDLGQYLKPAKRWAASLLRPRRRRGHQARIENFDRALREQPGSHLLFEDRPSAETVSALFHTGGTTGLPKLAQHRQRSILFTVWVAHELLLREEDVLLCALPLFHVFGAYITCVAPLASKSHVVQLCPAGFRAEGIMDSFWKLVERWRATFFLSVPAVFAALRQRPVDADVSSLRFAVCGSAPLPRELFRVFEQTTGLNILEGYGQTESTCVISCNPPAGERKLGSVGLPLPYSRVAAIRMEGAPEFLGADEIGEIVVRGPNTFAGYMTHRFNQDLFVHGDWMRTGDLGMVDSDGYVWITGRKKDLIIRSGNNIDPRTIEEALAEHPDVAFAAAVGAPDSKAGEMPVAFVELVEGSAASADELRTFAVERVADAMAHPVRLTVISTMPLTALGKVYKPQLRGMAIVEEMERAFEEAGIEASFFVEEVAGHGLCLRVTAEDREGARNLVETYAVEWSFSKPAEEDRL